MTKFEMIVGKAKVEKVTNGFQFTEGPVWVPAGYLLFSDIPADTIYKWTPRSTSADIFRAQSGHSNGLTLDREGRLLVCEHDRRVSRIDKDGNKVVLVERYEGKRLNSPNDIVVKIDGSIYFTDPPYGLHGQEDEKELEFNGVYRLAPDGTLTLLDDSFERPNGIAFSPDERLLYIDDSNKGHIRVFDVKFDGKLSNSRVFAKLKNSKEKGSVDGMKVDINGNIFCTGPGGIWLFDAIGDLLGVIKTPEVPANLAWGDNNLKTLYITARTGLYRMFTKTGGAPMAPC